MIDLALESLTTALRNSELLNAARGIRHDGGVGLALAGEPTRPLRDDEIRKLVAEGNTAEDWRDVRVVESYRPGRVRHCDFRGCVTLGRFEESLPGPGGLPFPTGVYRSTIANCVISHDALVRNVGFLANYVVGVRTKILDCGHVTCDGPTTFGNGIAIPIGPQCGGRWLSTFAEISLDLAIALTSPIANHHLAQRYAELLAEYMKQAQSPRGVIGGGATLANVAVVRNVFVGPAAEITAATRIENCTLLSSADEPIRIRDGACVAESVLQWGVTVNGPAVVERATLLEHSAVDRFGKVSESVIGPNSGVGGAEVTASLVGPFVGCHHQSLLIAARWPGGRGNLGFGAAAGCNHTSRAPDQEAILGEGLFIGLGTTLQYPADFGRSPYSVLASGLNLPPQKLSFPFSLVRPATEPNAGTPAGANVVIPGWVLTENLYSVQRCALKFRTRDRATRNPLAHDVFRPEVMSLVVDALRRLEEPSSIRDVYTEREIPGLGRNVLMERHRIAAIRAYGEHLDRFDLLRLLDRATHAIEVDRISALFETEPSLGDDLRRLSGLMEAFGTAVERSKTRDEDRGPLVIDDYARSHVPTREDAVIVQTWNEIRRIQTQVGSVLAHCRQHQDQPRVALVSGG